MIFKWTVEIDIPTEKLPFDDPEVQYNKAVLAMDEAQDCFFGSLDKSAVACVYEVTVDDIR